MSANRRVLLAAALTGLLFASRLSPVPALVDVATGAPVASARLAFPLPHLLLTPFSALADLITCNSLRQDIAFLAFVLLCGGPFRFFGPRFGRGAWSAAGPALKSLALYGGLVLAFLAWAVFFPRSPARLVLDDPDLLAVDFHSHSSRSWDGMRWFSPEANARWHERAGFGAAFITDHNRTDGAAEGKALSRAHWAAGDAGYASLEGEEVSLPDAHVVVLGNSKTIDNRLYGQGPADVERFLGDAQRVYGGVPVMSLPEYWRHYWGAPLERFAAAGAKGFEVRTTSPKALDFPPEKLREVVALCRAKDLFMAGASDNHGYGSAACVWNVVRVPGWRGLDPDRRQEAVTALLRRGGFSAVQVVARTAVAPAQGDAIWLDAPRALWTMLRAFTVAQCFVFLLWLWLPLVLFPPREA